MKKTVTGFVTILCAIGLAYSDIRLSAEYQASLDGWWTGTVIAVIAIGIANLFCPAVVKILWQHNQKLISIFGVCGFIAASLFSLSTAFERTTAGLDSKIHKAKSGNISVDLARSSYKDAKASLELIQSAWVIECVKGKPTSGPGPECDKQTSLLERARQEVHSAKDARKNAGAVLTEHAAAAAFEKVTTLNAAHYQNTQPLFLPLGLYFLAIAFATAGLELVLSTKLPANKESLPLEMKIRLFIDENNATQKEAAEHFNISRSTVSRKLKAVK